MISRLSSIITEALCKSQVIKEADRELYVYGFFILLSQGLFFLISALFGCIFGTLWESVVFYIMFSTLRCYAGGFHASKESVCTCCTTAALFMASVSIYILGKTESIAVPFSMLAVGSVVVYLLSPLYSEDKPLTSSEYLDYRQKSRAIVTTFSVIAIVAAFMHLPGILYIVSVSVSLESFLLIVGKVDGKVKQQDKQKSAF